jgi:hypothetical protein
LSPAGFSATSALVLISSITACGKSVYCRNSCIPLQRTAG